jgi:hypothetical protein
MEANVDLEANVETCDVCGGEVSGADVIREEMSAGEFMCPTPMTIHRACYDKAREVWGPDDSSYCVVDPDFPETQQWTPAAKSFRRDSRLHADAVRDDP